MADTQLHAEAEQAVRWLARVIPAVFACSGKYGTPLAATLFWSVSWNTRDVEPVSIAEDDVSEQERGEASQAAPAGEKPSDAASPSESSPAVSSEPQHVDMYLEEQAEAPLARLLLRSVSKLMFLPGYACYAPASKSGSAESIVAPELAWCAFLMHLIRLVACSQPYAGRLESLSIT